MASEKLEDETVIMSKATLDDARSDRADAEAAMSLYISRGMDPEMAAVLFSVEETVADEYEHHTYLRGAA